MRNPWEILRKQVLSTAQIRDIDRRAVEHFGMNSLVLMENAAGNCARWLMERFSERPKTVILCGSGNNGGDGVVIARHLRCVGWPVCCFVLGPMEKLSDDNRSNCKILLASGNSGLTLVQPNEYQLVIESITSAELIIDAMLGTGATGVPRSPMSEWIQAANDTKAARVAIDVPTGVDAESGDVNSIYFIADYTLTFVARKPAMATSDFWKKFGQIEVLPIGICEAQIEELLKACWSD
ncbi:MAG: NAD(P)H-hydrate epimerase [Pirellulales bacterium]